MFSTHQSYITRADDDFEKQNGRKKVENYDKFVSFYVVCVLLIEKKDNFNKNTFC